MHYGSQTTEFSCNRDRQHSIPFIALARPTQPTTMLVIQFHVCESVYCACLDEWKGRYRDRLAHELLPRLRAAAAEEERDGGSADGGNASGNSLAAVVAALREEYVTLHISHSPHRI